LGDNSGLRRCNWHDQPGARLTKRAGRLFPANYAKVPIGSAAHTPMAGGFLASLSANYPHGAYTEPVEAAIQRFVNKNILTLIPRSWNWSTHT